MANGLGLLLVYGELAVHGIVSKRRKPSHPHAFFLGGGDLVPDALAGDLPLELGEGEEDVEGQSSYRRGGVESLSHRDKRHRMGVEGLDHPDEVREGAGEPVHLVDNDYIDPARLDVIQEALERRPLGRPSREASVVVACRQWFPPFSTLALDVRLARLSLGIERAKFLLQTFF